ncbi:MAG TPA: hypothetical protein VF476_01075 [Chitinophagaceae bacterium]
MTHQKFTCQGVEYMVVDISDTQMEIMKLTNQGANDFFHDQSKYIDIGFLSSLTKEQKEEVFGCGKVYDVNNSKWIDLSPSRNMTNVLLYNNIDTSGNKFLIKIVK